MIKRITKKSTIFDASGIDSFLPIIIGVTGHRDLRPEDIIAATGNMPK